MERRTGSPYQGMRRRTMLQNLGLGLVGANLSTSLTARMGSFTSDSPSVMPHAQWHSFEVGTGDTLLVSVRVAGAPVQAVLDTGSGATIISKLLAEKLGMVNLEPRKISGLSGKAPVGLVRNVEVVLGERTRVLPFAVVGDLAAISAAYGSPVDMMLGADVLSGGCITLDIAKRRFAFERSGSFAGGKGWVTLPVGRGDKQELFVLGSVAGGEPVPLMLDTGSSSALMLSSAYVRENNFFATGMHSTAALGGVEGVQIVHTFTATKVSLGGLSVEKMPAIALDRWASTRTVGNIGMPLLGQFDVVLDVAQAQLWLRPAPPAGRLPILKDRSGLGLAPSATDLTVIHVAVGSPAARGGWAIGDRIVAIDGIRVDNSYTRNSLWRWRYERTGKRALLKLADGTTRTLTLEDYY